MHKRETKVPPGSWAKPAVRRIMSGAAEVGAAPDGDGSGTLS